MGVYIKDTGMPRGCNECFFAPRCWVRPLDPTFFASIKPDGCPMVEVEVPHGDLIDRYEVDDMAYQLYDNIQGMWSGYKVIDEDDINDAKVIIPEEGE